MTNLRAGLIGLGHDGPPPRPGAARAGRRRPRRHRRSRWRRARRGAGRRPGARVDSTSCSSSGSTTRSWRRRPSATTRSALQLAEAGVHALIEKPLAHRRASAQEIAEAFEAAGLVGAVGHIERYNPALQQRAAAAGSTASSARSTRSPPAGRARSRPDRGRRRHPRPRHPRHRPHRLGGAAAVRLGRRAAPRTAPAGRTRTWSPSPGSSPTARSPTTWSTGCRRMKERVTVITGEKGASSPTRSPPTSPSSRTASCRPSGSAVATVPRGHRGRHDPVRLSQARAAAGRARDVPRRASWARTRTSSRSSRGCGHVAVANAVAESAATGTTVIDRAVDPGRGVRICVVGLGKIGLPLAVQFASEGHAGHRGRRQSPTTVELVNGGDRAVPG